MAALAGLAAGCGDDGGFPDAGGVEVAARGAVAVTWSLTDAAGKPITCDQVGATTVALTLHSLDGVFGVADSFACTNSPSTSMSVAAGNYSASFELHGPSLTAVTAPDQARVVVTASETTQLAATTFVVDATGSLVLELAAPPSTSNCAAGGQGKPGAGITGDTLTIDHGSDGCQPVTFARSKAGAPAGTYTVDCTTPAVSTCIETDETLTATGIPSGAYTVHVRGKTGALECWKNDDALAVPAQGKALTRTLNLAFEGTPGC